MSTPLPWAMVPTNFWSLPVVQMAGHDAAVMVFTLLIDAGQWGSDESLPPECLNPRRLAITTGLSERDGRKAATEHVTAALADAFEAGLLVRDGERVWFGPGLWVKRDDVRRKLRADRVRKKRKDSAQPDHAVPKVCAQRGHDVRQREEKRREEESKQRAGAREGQAVEQVELASLPGLDEQGERIAATLDALDSQEHAGKAEAHQRLLRSLQHRGCEPTARHMGEMTTMLASRPTAVIAQLGVMVERGTGPIRTPVGLLKSLLPDAVEAVEAEAKARRVMEMRNAESRRQAEHRQAAQQWMRDNPEKAAENARRLAALAESLGGGS